MPGVRPGSIAEADQAAARNRIVPQGIITGLVQTVADHLSAWAELAGSKRDGTLLLHLQADYTLLRPVLEGLVELIWILDGADSSTRIRCALEIARIEHTHGSKLTVALRKAGVPDGRTAAGIEGLGQTIESAAGAIGLDGAKFLGARAIDPSSITKKITNRVPGPSLQTYRYWAITSAHAHGQLMTTLRFGTETALPAPHEGGALFEPDEEMVAELLQFVGELLNIAVKLLNDQGYELRP